MKEFLLRQPGATAKSIASELRISEIATQNSIDRLVIAGVLTQSSAGRRTRTWQAPDILDALDALGERARRRR